MLKTFIAAALCCVSASAFAARAAGCEAPQTAFMAMHMEFAVAGSGRLHFHTAPDEACRDAKLFIVPGDRVTLNDTAGKQDAWANISYQAKNGTSYSGWVRANRLRFLGASGSNLTPAAHKRLTKAAAEAKAGKLGIP